MSASKRKTLARVYGVDSLFDGNGVGLEFERIMSQRRTI